MNEWIEAGRQPDFLLTGSRLDSYQRWVAKTAMHLTTHQQRYLDTAVEARTHARRLDDERSAQEEKTERAARRRLWGLVTAVLGMVGLGVGLFVLVYEPEPVRVALVAPSAETTGSAELLAKGLDRAERELGVDVVNLSGRSAGLEKDYRELAEAETDLIIIDPGTSGWPWVDDVIAQYPATAFAVIDGILPPAGAQSVYFADEEGAYLAGVAAALTTETGVIGFVGGFQGDTTEGWRAGYEAGARAVDPDIDIVATYVSILSGANQDLAGGRAAADQLYHRRRRHPGSDANQGVIEAAVSHRHPSIRSDWSIEIDDLRPHVLTSAITQFDVAIFETIQVFIGSPRGSPFSPWPTAVGWHHLPTYPTKTNRELGGRQPPTANGRRSRCRKQSPPGMVKHAAMREPRHRSGRARLFASTSSTSRIGISSCLAPTLPCAAHNTGYIIAPRHR